MKKRTKKLLLLGALEGARPLSPQSCGLKGRAPSRAPRSKSFFATFFSKKVVLAYLLLASPAYAQPGDCGTIVVPTGVGVAPSDDITSLNPLLVTSLYNAQAAGLLYLGLIWIGRGAKIDWSRSLASAITTPDQGTTYNVTLRPWHWSDGVPVTTADVAYTWKLIQELGPAYAGFGAGGMPDIVKSFTVISPTQFQVVLKRQVNPTWYTYNGLSQFLPLPEHSWGKYNIDQIFQAQSTPSFYNVVDGPLFLQSLDTGLQAIFVPNPAFEGPKLHFDRLVFRFFHTDGAMLQQVESGDLDMANAPLNFWKVIQHVPGVHVVSMPPPLSFDETAFNFRNDKVAFLRDVRVRQAMADAIDQQGILNLVYQGQGVPIYGPVPPVPPTFLSPEMRAGKYPVGYDPAKARALLEQAGFTPGPDGIMQKNGQRLSFTILFPGGNATTDQRELIEQQEFKKVGIELIQQNIEFNQMLAIIDNPHASWEAAGLGDTLGGYPSGEDLFKTGSFENAGGYSDPKMDQLIDDSTDKPGLQGLFDYENYASEQQPVLFEAIPEIPLLVSNRIQNAADFIDPAANYYPDVLTCTASES